ncbi:MAG: hypothetical protein K8S99_05135 [Planctomycetes bacterium]|nr:hypothetical protein [Planctomycetota bacterium]
MKKALSVWPPIRWMAAAFVIALFLPAWAVMADQVRLTDGSVHKGKVASQDEYVVVLDEGVPPNVTRKTFDRGTVEEITLDAVAPAPAPAPAPKPAGAAVAAPVKPASTMGETSWAAKPPVHPETPTYIVVPLQGEFGVEIMGDVTARCLEVAKKQNPSVIILEVNSGGGLVAELFKMIDLVVDWQGTEAIPLVVVVKGEAYSAAAILSMCIKQVYMTHGSAMGAALVIQMGPGMIDAVAEKFSSAIRAKARTGCEFAGRNPLIVEGMMDPDVVLSLARDKAGKPVILKGSPHEFRSESSRFGVQPKMFKPEHKLLSLTPGEAIDCGAIDGTVAGYEDLGKTLGLAGWTDLGPAARNAFKSHTDEIAANKKAYQAIVKQIKTGISNVRQASGTQLTATESSVNQIKAAITRLEKMVEKYDYMKMTMAQDFPMGLERLKAECDVMLGQIKNARVQMRQR